MTLIKVENLERQEERTKQRTRNASEHCISKVSTTPLSFETRNNIDSNEHLRDGLLLLSRQYCVVTQWLGIVCV